jgi:hypothetical protein
MEFFDLHPTDCLPRFETCSQTFSFVAELDRGLCADSFKCWRQYVYNDGVSDFCRLLVNADLLSYSKFEVSNWKATATIFD